MELGLGVRSWNSDGNLKIWSRDSVSKSGIGVNGLEFEYVLRKLNLRHY